MGYAVADDLSGVCGGTFALPIDALVTRAPGESGPQARLIVRRGRQHPGAQLSLTDHNGCRFQAILTDQTDPDMAVLECRRRQPPS
ncbi:MAG: hypothetical protein ABR992_00985 [Solirubrobacteraceae bacterium]